ncbi:NAD(P)-dependent oxidoreductase [Halobacillus naozhouensis]|uniref:NAD(P)-dependent oxidoreductase n=1 Tax=Halobacillus naozhouensis TaxID=554880 RepID=A0ABY8J7A5_9BACI|nr:NAD(P)-dependent oxidoreductase [Halobacillus naozhouensis]WFT76826.1 NAD(P)-dependent oxidoreductase [Halobacillus naozhouensis]
MKIGLVGLGNMGGRIGKRLLKEGHELHVYDVNKEALIEFQSLGAIPAQSLTELASKNNYILTVLPNADIVKDVVLGEKGLVTGLEPTSVLIDMTSSIPKVTNEVGNELKKHKVEMLDAPVSGGVKRAEAGTLTVMVGGDLSTYEQLMPIFESIGSKITHVGKSGTGHAVKALNNLVSATTLSVTLEALAVGMKTGIDPYKMLEVINHSTGKSNSSENKIAQQILSGNYEISFTMDLMYKDLTTAMSIAETTEAPSPISQAVYNLWGEAEKQMEENKVDHTEIAHLIGERSGINFSKDGTKYYYEYSEFIDK